VTTCPSGCGAPVLWAVTPRGNRIPLDVELVPGGNLELRSGIAFRIRAEASVHAYRCHFASCPRADQPRRRRARRKPYSPPVPPTPEARELLERLRNKDRHG